MESNWIVDEHEDMDVEDLRRSADEDWETDVEKMAQLWKKVDLKAHRCSENAKKSVEGHFVNFQVFSDSVFTVTDQVVGMLHGVTSAISYYQFFCRLFKAVFLPNDDGWAWALPDLVTTKERDERYRETGHLLYRWENSHVHGDWATAAKMRYAMTKGLDIERIPETQGQVVYLQVDLTSPTGYGGKLGQVEMNEKTAELSEEEEELEDPGPHTPQHCYTPLFWLVTPLTPFVGDDWDDLTAWMLTPRRRALWEAEKERRRLAMENGRLRRQQEVRGAACMKRSPLNQYSLKPIPRMRSWNLLRAPRCNWRIRIE